MPRIKTPLLNPINIVDQNRILPANYNWHHFDGWLSSEQITQFETYKCDAQKWQKNDILFLQFKADFDPIRLQVRNSTGLVVLSQIMSNVASVGSDYYFEAQIAFDSFDEGYYLFEILAGDPVLISLEATLFHIKEQWPGTLLFRYQNAFNNYIFWETGIYMTMRIDGVIPFDAPASIRTVYTDQPQSEATVKGDPYRTYKLYVGTDGGLPNWIIDKLEEIIDQNSLTIDGKGFAPVSGATWNVKRSERYPWAQWNIEMRETVNRREKIFDGTGLLDKKIVEEFIVEGALFGPVYGAANDNTYTINKLG